jgi:hypothetical protein
MLFLLNDVVFDLDEACPVTPGDARRFETLELDYVLELGCELFSPAAGCDPTLVEPQFCALPDATMRQLKTRAAKGQLNAVTADRAVWMRMAA